MKYPMTMVVSLTVILLSSSVCLFYLCGYYSNKNNLIFTILYGFLGCILLLCSCVSALYPFCGKTSNGQQRALSISSHIQNEESIDQSVQCGIASNLDNCNDGIDSQSHRRDENIPWQQRPLSTSSHIQNEESIDQSAQCGNASNLYHRNDGIDSQSRRRDENIPWQKGNTVTLQGNTGNMRHDDPLMLLNSSIGISNALRFEERSRNFFNDQVTMRAKDKHSLTEGDKMLSDSRSSYGSSDCSLSTSDFHQREQFQMDDIY